MNERVPVAGSIWRHFEGTEYTITGKGFDATRWEETGELREVVFYKQEVAGQNPVGTMYSREIEDFLGQMEHEGQTINKFELVQKQ